MAPKKDTKKEPEKKHPEPKVVKFESTQKCVLTDKELQGKGQELADAIDEGTRLESQFNEVKQQFKGKIDGAVARSESLSSTIRAKSEYRLVKCDRTFDWKAGKVTETRNDTGEIFNERLMTDSDRQQHLTLEDRQVPFTPAGQLASKSAELSPKKPAAAAPSKDEQLLDEAEETKPDSEFVASVREFFEENGEITDGQRTALRKIVDGE